MGIKMEVYSPDLLLLDVLDDFESIMWQPKAFFAGTFSLDAALTKKNIELLKPEADGREKIIWIEGESAGIVENIDEDTEKQIIIARGKLLTGILERRILWGLYDLSGKAPAIMQYLVKDNAITPTRGDTEARKIPGLVLDESYKNDGETIRKQKTGGSLLEALTEIGEANMVAFGVRFNPDVPQMEFWTRPCKDHSINQGKNDQVFYSTELDDVLHSEYSRDSGESKNIAYVAGEGEGNNRVYVTVDEIMETDVDTSGLDPKKDYATHEEVDEAIQAAIYDSWEASY